jgi:hypothetical protein
VNASTRLAPHQEKETLLRCGERAARICVVLGPRSPRRMAANTPPVSWSLRPCISWQLVRSRTVDSEIAWLTRESGMQRWKAGGASDFTGRGEGLVDFPEEAPLEFRDFLWAHAEYASPLGQLCKVGLDVELRDVRREALKRQHVLIS